MILEEYLELDAAADDGHLREVREVAVELSTTRLDRRRRHAAIGAADERDQRRLWRQRRQQLLGKRDRERLVQRVELAVAPPHAVVERAECDLNHVHRVRLSCRAVAQLGLGDARRWTLRD